MKYPKHIIDALPIIADAIISARDFCGNEREAAIDAMADLGYRPHKQVIADAFRIANSSWEQWQIEAGVKKPISADERVSIENMMNKA